MSIKVTNTFTSKGYSWVQYHCDICGYDGKLRVDHYKDGVGCSICAGKTVLKGYNDVATTDPEIAKFIVPYSDAESITRMSHKKVNTKCSICGFESYKSVADLCKRGFRCKVCDKGNSFPNRVMTAILWHFNIKCFTEHHFDWAVNYRYDFYLPAQNMIIEMNGQQHYKERLGWASLEDIQTTDAAKERIARENGVNLYYCVPAIKSDSQYLRKSINDSGILDRLGIIIDDDSWSQIIALAKSNVAKKCLLLWNEGYKDFKEIAAMVGLSASAVYGYIKDYAYIGLCDYDANSRRIENYVLANAAHRRRVKCVNSGTVYESIHEASEATMVSERNIQNCLAGRSRSAGKDSNGDKMIWEYI